MQKVALLAAGLGVAIAIIAAPTAAGEPRCVDVGPRTTSCSTGGSAQIRTTPAPIGPFIRYGCTAGYTSYCDLPFPGGGVLISR